VGPGGQRQRRRRGVAGGRGPAELGQVGREAVLGRCTGGSGRVGWRARLLGRLAAAGCCWARGWAAWPGGLDRKRVGVLGIKVWV
jgi:hypothetical protein